MKNRKIVMTALVSLAMFMSSTAFAMTGSRDMDGMEQHEQEQYQEQESSHNGDDYGYGYNDDNGHQDAGPQNHEGRDMRHSQGPQVYENVNVDISNDLFGNAQVFNGLVGGMIPFVDDNGDGIVDYAQDTPHFRNLEIGPFRDSNGDSIHDAFQTWGFYKATGMNNFVDVDGDGLCDNYEADPFSHDSEQNRWMGSGQRSYGMFSVDTGEDIFVNPEAFDRVAGDYFEFVDDNGDGVCDYFQNTTAFESLGIGPFTDQNEDSIHDAFQTWGFYKAAGMNNFVDVDGDGICDNYEADPVDMM